MKFTQAASAILVSLLVPTAVAVVPEELCSCSPLVFELVLSLGRTCSDGDGARNLALNGGIDGAGTLCAIDAIDFSASSGGGGDDTLERGGGSGSRDDGSAHEGGGGTDEYKSESDNALVPVEITSVQFLETDSSGSFRILNQDDSLAVMNTSLKNGDAVRFNSVAGALDPAVPAEDQPDVLPGGVILILTGRNAQGEAVRNRILWTYTRGCGEGDAVVREGDAVGWITFGNSEPGRGALCPALATTTSTTSTASVTASTSMSTTTTTTTTTPERATNPPAPTAPPSPTPTYGGKSGKYNDYSR